MRILTRGPQRINDYSTNQADAYTSETDVLISASVPDWSRECPRQFWDPGRKLLKSIRDYQRLGQNPTFLNRLRQKFCIVRHRFWSVVTGAEIHLSTQIGGGLLIPHPNGIVIHPKAIIGVNCLIFQQVTLGTRNGLVPPVIGGHVDVGAGAKVLGDIRLGDHISVGANAVVLTSIPDGVTVVGVPAKQRVKP